MAFSLLRILKGIVIREESSLSPKEFQLTPSGSSGTKTTLTTSQTADRTVILPDANDTLVGKVTVDTLENKTIVVADNTITTEASGNLTATELNAALAELEAEITQFASDLQDHINDPVDAHDASAISVIPSGNLTATDTQSALEELQTDIDNHILDTSTHGVTGDIVGTSDIQTLSNKTFTNQTTIADFLTVVEQSSVATTPSMGQRLLYAKSDGFYEKDFLGAETKIGSGGSGASDVITDTFVGDGIQTDFTLSQDPGIKSNIFAFFQGVHQQQANYSVTGTTISFSTAPPNLVPIEIKYGAPLDIGTPANLTVSTAKIQDAAVTSAKLNTPVQAIYRQSGVQTIPAGVNEIVNFPLIIKDTDGLVTTGANWKFTANRTITVTLNVAVRFGPDTFSPGQQLRLAYGKNAVSTRILDIIDIETATSNGKTLKGLFTVDLALNDTLQVSVFNATSGAKNLDPAATYIQIIEVR